MPYDPYHPALDIMVKLDNVSPLLHRSHNYFDFRRAPYIEISKFFNSFNWLETIMSLDVDKAVSYTLITRTLIAEFVHLSLRLVLSLLYLNRVIKTMSKIIDQFQF